MPVEKEVTKLIPRIYKYNYENNALFFFVKGQLAILPTLSLDQAIQNFFRIANIGVDDWDVMSAKSTYNRMQHDLYNCRHDTSKTT